MEGITGKDHFLASVAQRAILKKFPGSVNWPPPNFWAMVSNVKYNITDDQVPALMKHYNVTHLPDFQCGTIEVPINEKAT
jgi:hypothetical protein